MQIRHDMVAVRLPDGSLSLVRVLETPVPEDAPASAPASVPPTLPDTVSGRGYALRTIKALGGRLTARRLAAHTNQSLGSAYQSLRYAERKQLVRRMRTTARGGQIQWQVLG